MNGPPVLKDTKFRALREWVLNNTPSLKQYWSLIWLKATAIIEKVPQLCFILMTDNHGFGNPILLAELSFWLGVLQIALYYAQENSLAIKNQIIIIWLVLVLIYIEIRKGEKSGSN